MSVALRIYLLAGLVAHKVVWELLKRTDRQTTPTSDRRLPLGTRVVKLLKIGILAGVVLQTVLPEGWPAPPLSDTPLAIQIFGVVLFTFGNVLAIVARSQLGRNWSDIETASVLNHQVVVARGVYRHIRHPIYVGDLLLLVGLELALNSSAVFAMLLLVPVVLRQAVREEQQMIRTLDGYDEYCRATWRFIPFVV